MILSSMQLLFWKTRDTVSASSIFRVERKIQVLDFASHSTAFLYVDGMKPQFNRTSNDPAINSSLTPDYK